MKSAVAALLLLAVAAQAQFYGAGYPYAYSGYPYTTAAYPYSGYPYAYAPAFTANQYHSQDELGQASFGYSHPGQAAVNYRDAAGNQVGSYAYINPEGKEIRVSYVADANGFRVLSNALPEGPAPVNAVLPAPVQDTAEVAAAKASHMAALAAAKANDGALPVVPVNTLSAPTPVDDTPEVKQAKTEFFAAFKAAAAAAAAAGDE